MRGEWVHILDSCSPFITCGASRSIVLLKREGTRSDPFESADLNSSDMTMKSLIMRNDRKSRSLHLLE